MSQGEDPKARLAQALRDNLRRRKAQARAGAASAGAGGAGGNAIEDAESSEPVVSSDVAKP